MSKISIWHIERPYRVLPLLARLNIGAMLVKGYWAFPKDGLVSYPEYSFGECYQSLEIQSVYSAALADRATN